jgi:NDP-sugar pyrophosphorylase family protein
MTAGTTIGFVLATADLLGANGTTATTQDTILTAGSIIGSSSQIEEGTTVGGTVVTSGTVTTSSDSLLKTGSVLQDDSVLGAGTTERLLGQCRNEESYLVETEIISFQPSGWCTERAED